MMMRSFQRKMRPTLLAAVGGLRELESYKGVTTGNTAAGTSKNYYRELILDPPTPAGELTYIGNARWELGVTILALRLYDAYWWQTPLITGVQTDIASGSTTSVLMTIEAIDENEDPLGTCNTTTISTINTTNTDVADPVWLAPPTWSILGQATMSSSGFFEGGAHGFLVTVTWGGEVHTNGPTVGGPTMQHWGGIAAPYWPIWAVNA